MMKLLGVAAALLTMACGDSAQPIVLGEPETATSSSSSASSSTGSGGGDAGGDGECTNDGDCKNGLVCVSKDCVVGLQEGENCVAGAQPCAVGLWCDDKCIPQFPAGQICGGNDSACLSGMCVKAADGYARCQ